MHNEVILCSVCNKPMRLQGTKYLYDKATDDGILIRIYGCDICHTFLEIWP